MEELFKLIEAAQLKPEDVVRMCGGNVSMNLASQWLKARKNKRKLAKVTMELLRLLCEQKLSNKHARLLFYELDTIYLMSSRVREVTGVYFLFDGCEVVYVGKGTNVFSRINSHLSNKKFDAYTFLECTQDVMQAVEAVYINKFKPKYNQVRPIGVGLDTEPIFDK